MTRLMTVEQVADWLQVHPRTVQLWARRGDIPGIKVGRMWRFSETAIQQARASRDPWAKPTRTRASLRV